MGAHLDIFAEDRFALLDMTSEEDLFVHPFVLANFAVAMRQLGRRWDPLWDFRSGSLYEDIRDAFREAASYQPPTGWTVVAAPDDVDRVRSALTETALTDVRRQPRVIPMQPRNLQPTALDLAPFDDDSLADPILDYGQIVTPTPSFTDTYLHNATEFGLSAYVHLNYEAIETELKFAGKQSDDDGEYFLIRELEYAERARLLDAFLTQIASHSLLVELGIHLSGDSVTVVPYHSHSLHQVPDARDELVVVRPARRHARYIAAFRADLARLEMLLGQKHVKERQIEELLLANPLFLRGLNYERVYAQVVLPRPGGNPMRPDIIAEPIDSDWADIIEIKLPSEPVLVGRPNRARLAAGITSVVRQLREYAAYFDERRVAERVEAKYGFKCHRPRLTAIVGRDPTGYSQEETKRAMSSFPDVEIVTYDRLLRVARSIPLI